MPSLWKSLQEFCCLGEKNSKEYQNGEDISRNIYFSKIRFVLKISRSKSLFIWPPGTAPWTFTDLYSVAEQTDIYFVY